MSRHGTEGRAGEKKRVERSTTVLLVKNLAYEVTHSTLTKLFEPFGSLEQVENFLSLLSTGFAQITPA